jgi:pyruvate/2-oxoglutarate dehydrogenase complex dihydrolipoamide dehydrogenase (E3) component
VAGAHGALAVENAFTGAARRIDYRHLPRVTFTTPNIAAVGMTDAQATAADIRCECRVLPLAYVPRALVNRDTRGLVKIVADADTGRIVGVSAVAQAAGELAAAATYILAAGMTVDQVANLWWPLPDHDRGHQDRRAGLHHRCVQALLLRVMTTSTHGRRRHRSWLGTLAAAASRMRPGPGAP